MAIPEVKKIVRSVSLKEARSIAEEIFTLTTGKEVKMLLTEKLKKIVPDVLI
jgi:phosphotransferase system enzyme I (PtsI)